MRVPELFSSQHEQLDQRHIHGDLAYGRFDIWVRSVVLQLVVADVEIGTLKHGTASTLENIDSSVLFGQYVNSSKNALGITVEASQNFANNQTLQFVDHGGSHKTTWFHAGEVQA